MTKRESSKSIERLFPFAKRARVLIVGQHIILRSKSQLHFVLLTHDISDRGKSEALRKFKHYPVIQHYRSAELATHFDVQGVKLMGFRKSGISKSIYAELKRYRINEPVVSRKTAPADEEESAATNRRHPGSRKSATEARSKPTRSKPARSRPKSQAHSIPKRRNPGVRSRKP